MSTTCIFLSLELIVDVTIGCLTSHYVAVATCLGCKVAQPQWNLELYFKL